MVADAERADVRAHFSQSAQMHRGVVEGRVLVPDRLQAAQPTRRIGFVPSAAVGAREEVDVGRRGDRGVEARFGVHSLVNAALR